jgi:hypothetical protein
MAIFILILVSACVNSLLYEAIQKDRSLWYTLPISVLASVLSIYALSGQLAEEFAPTHPLLRNMPELTSIMLFSMVAIDVVTVVITIICLVKDARFWDFRPFFTHSPLVAFVLAMISFITYSAVTANMQ